MLFADTEIAIGDPPRTKPQTKHALQLHGDPLGEWISKPSCPFTCAGNQPMENLESMFWLGLSK